MVTYVALPYQAYRIGHSSLIVGLLSLTELVPLLATAFVGGALADSVDRRHMVRVTESAMCLTIGALVVNSVLGTPHLWVLFVVAFVAVDFRTFSAEGRHGLIFILRAV
jgi:MFS family permease